MALLDADDLYAGYGETEILHGVTASVDSKEIVSVIGPNGAGKSTLIKTIIGLLTPTKGSIRFQGAEIAGRNPEELVAEGLGYVPQAHSIFPSLTVLENLEMGAITRRGGGLHRAGQRLGSYAPWRFGRKAKGGPPPRPEISEAEFRARVDHVLHIFPNLEPKVRQKAGALS